jgi:galactose-1-phosphate uridylyltransferase
MEFLKECYDGVEYRFDPLTHHQTRINPVRAKRVLQSASAGTSGEAWIKATQEKCPFCPESIHEATPCFSADFVKEGRIQLGETFIFPNLNPFSQCHAVATLSPQHFLDLDQFDKKLLANNLSMSRDYFLTAYGHYPQARYPIYLWNYLPPSAGSIIHPHVQLMVERAPIPEQKNVINKAEVYFEKHGRSYWDDLVEQEKQRAERYIGRVETIHIIASYAPRGFREVTLLVEGACSFTDLEDQQIEALAGCISTILKCYKTMGVGSFNLVSFSAGIDERNPYYTLHFKMISRPYPQGIYTNDSGPFERFYDVWVIDTLPEMVTEALKKFF